MAGASGYLGGHLIARLLSKGHAITQLVRRPAHAPNEIQWDPYSRLLDPVILEGADVVVNLGGVGVADQRWNPRYKREIRMSRTVPTQVLAEAVAEAKVPALVNASAVGWYGDSGKREVDETADYGRDFLGVTSKAWEDATIPARENGARVTMLRTGHVLSADSVIIQKLMPVFKCGIGGRFGSGRQYFPWVSLLDWLGAVHHIIDSQIAGPVNIVGPNPATNREFTKAMGTALRRPTPTIVPPAALKLAAGGAAVELLRGSRVIPKALNDSGYQFRHPSVIDAVRWCVNSR